MDVTRRGFMKLSATAVGATSLTALGFSAKDAFAEVRTFKLAHTSETRNTCPYCAVGCGVIIYGLGDRAKNARTEIVHIEGDPDHPVNRGTLCPKGASLLDFVHSPQRLKYPEYRKPGSDHFERVSWEFALDRIARLMK
ncbi:MAG: twin-arginine translocation signal domain-containing protein, partial [Thermoanaerobaculales bacterium]